MPFLTMQEAFTQLYHRTYLSFLIQIGKVIDSFHYGIDFSFQLHGQLTLTNQCLRTESERHTISVSRTVVVGIAIVVDIAEVSGRVSKREPPIAPYSANNLFFICENS